MVWIEFINGIMSTTIIGLISLSIKERIFALVEEYFSQEQEVFEPGKSSIGVGFPCYDHREVISALESLLDLRLSQGKKVQRFETEFSKYVGSKHGIAVNSGSSANLLALASLVKSKRVPIGSEVIVPAATFTTVVSPIIQNGLIPVFVDIESDYYNIDPQCIKEAVTENTGLIMPVHSLGCPADMDAIMKIAEDHQLPVLEDCCEAHSAMIDGKVVGSFGDLGAYSFFVAHNMTSGEGGMVITDDDVLCDILRSMREFGRLRDYEPDQPRFYYTDESLSDYDERYVFEIQGYNVRMTDIHASLGIEQLKKLDNLNNERVRIASNYNKHLSKYDEFIQIPRTPDGYFHSFYGYTLLIKESAPFVRTQLVRFLEDRMIETRAFMGGNLSIQPAYRNSNFRVSGNLDITEAVTDRAFFIGCHPRINKEAQDYVLETFDQFFSQF